MNLDRIRNLSRRSKVIVAGGALVLAGFVGGAAVSVTGVASADETSEDGCADDDGFGHHGRGELGPRSFGGSGEEPLTGGTADQVRAAVEAEYPDATIMRLETDSEGAYEAHVMTADGEALEVKVSEDFEVTGAEERGFGGPGHFGPGGAPLTGDTADQVRAAAEAEHPDGTVVWVTTNPDGGYWAYVLTAEEEKIRLAIDEDFTVTGSETRGEGPSS